MKYFFLISLLFLSSLISGEVNTLHLLPYKEVCHDTASGGHTSHHRGGKEMYSLEGDGLNLNNVKATYITSNLQEINVEINSSKVTLPKSGFDNYHVLVVESSSYNRYSSAVFYKYKHGRPSKTSPTKLTHKQKSLFEIIPNPLPKEHNRYTGSKKYSFLLMFDGKALGNHDIVLQTTKGTLQNYTTNNKGEFEVTLPNDFENVKMSRRGNKPEIFVLSTQLKKMDKEYFTSFSNEYHVNSHDYWSSTTQGAFVLFVGLLIGLVFVYRRRKNG